MESSRTATHRARIRKGAATFTTLAAALCAGLCTHAAVQPNRAGQLALTGGTIYISPADEPIRDGVVLIRDGKIAAVGGRAAVPISKSIQTIDCSGLTITAAFWNSHVHFFERKWADAGAIPADELSAQLQDMLTRYGFTSAFDLGSQWTNTRRLRERIESREVAGPRIRSTGEALIAAGALPSEAVIRTLGYMTVPNTLIVDGPQAAAAASRKLVDAGVDGIKVHLQPPPAPNPPLAASALEAAVGEAHRAGKPVFVHPNSGADVLAAVGAGVDVIAHTTPSSGPWNEAILASIKGRRVALTPTLMVWRELLRHDRLSTGQQSDRRAIGQLRAWVAAGGTVLFGNDLGASRYDPTEEYTSMAEGGMSFRQILAALTTAPAERFGASAQLGRVAPGFSADLAVLKGDPSKDVRSLATVQYTLRDGQIVYQAAR